MQERQWKGVTGGHGWRQPALMWLLRHIPVAALYPVMACALPFYMLVNRRGYLAIYRYFRHHFARSPLKAFLGVWRNHYLFGQCLLDRFALYAGQRDVFRMEVATPAELQLMNSVKSSLILVSAHIGNIEMSTYLTSHSKHVYTLVFGGERASLMNRRIRTMKEHNVTMVPVIGDLSHIKALRDACEQGADIHLLCDRTIGSEKTVACPFLNGIANFPSSAFKLAVQWNIPVFAMFIVKTGRSRYRFYVRHVNAQSDGASRSERVEQYTKTFVAELESVLRRHPEQWFNFYPFWNE